jgi:hypothetical protein
MGGGLKLLPLRFALEGIVTMFETHPVFSLVGCDPISYGNPL